MRYIMLMYAEEGAWPPDEHETALRESIALCHELAADGKYHGAAPLHPPRMAKCVRVREGRPWVSDGPFAETKEQLGGYFVIEARDLDEALEIAARIPGARRGTAEIRPIMDPEALV